MSRHVEIWIEYRSSNLYRACEGRRTVEVASETMTRSLAGRARTRRGALKIALGGGEHAAGIGWIAVIRGTKEALLAIGATQERDGRELRWRFYDNHKRPISVEECGC